jgi:putative ABC transport system permease protein
MTYLTLGNGQLLLAALLILINLGLSSALRLGLARSLAIASLRMVVQLLMIGFVLEWLFQQQHPGLVLLLGLAMTAIAGHAAIERTRYRFAGMLLDSFLSILTAAALVSGLALEGILHVQPWYNPQYVIPLLGMVLGNTLNGVSLGLDRFMEDLVRRQAEIELLLSLGATRWEAARGCFQDALRTGMMPMLNSMAVTGVVSLPGMMTGQILAGAAPTDAVRYQIVILFMIAAATALGTLIILWLSYRHFFDQRDRLRLEGLERRAS